MHFLKNTMVLAISLILLAGCHNGGKNILTPNDDTNIPATPDVPDIPYTPDEPVITAFNLNNIVAANTGGDNATIKQMKVTWDSAVADNIKGVKYTLCLEDDSQNEQCSPLATVTDATEVTIALESLVKALSSEYFVMANYAGEIQKTSVKAISPDEMTKMIGVFKAASPQNNSYFGGHFALNYDGTTLVVGAVGESSNASGINGVQEDASLPSAGAAFIFHYDGKIWTQQAYLKSDTPKEKEFFGYDLAINAAGNKVVIQANTKLYVYDLENAQWQLTNMIDNDDNGFSGLDMSADGNTIAVRLLDGSSPINPVLVYQYDNVNKEWSKPQDVRPPMENIGSGNQYGSSISLSNDGTIMAVLDPASDSIDADHPTDHSLKGSGAIYLYKKSATDNTWQQTAYLKTQSPKQNAGLFNLKISPNNNLLAVTQVKNQDDMSCNSSDPNCESTGSIYLYDLNDNNKVIATITDTELMKAGMFGFSTVFGPDEKTLYVSGYNINADTDTNMTLGNTEDTAGIAVFENIDNTWVKTKLLHAANIESNLSVPLRGRGRLAISGDGNTLAYGLNRDTTPSKGINGTPDANAQQNISSGTVYVY